MQYKKAHFIGIAGKGMSATALLLRQMGVEISGSDAGFYPPVSTYLQNANIPFHEGYKAENIPADADVIIIGKNAKLIPEENEEVKAAFAWQAGLPAVRRVKSFPDILEELTKGKETLVVRGEILPVIALSRLLGWPQVQQPEYGVLMQTAERSFILAVDNFAGRDDAVIKALDDFRPRGVAGVTTLSNGQIVLILDMKELLADLASNAERDTRGSHVRALELFA
jgi:hypothetical protein